MGQQLFFQNRMVLGLVFETLPAVDIGRKEEQYKLANLSIGYKEILLFMLSSPEQQRQHPDLVFTQILFPFWN